MQAVKDKLDPGGLFNPGAICGWDLREVEDVDRGIAGDQQT